MNHLPALELPSKLNYIGVFLTLDCNLACAYCINGDDLMSNRRPFAKPESVLKPENWIRALSRIPFREDLPITLQGGEPTMYGGGRGLGQVIAGLPHHFDLLTNLVVKAVRFQEAIDGNFHKFQRPAPYPSIRVSYHPAEMERVFGDDAFAKLVERCEDLGKIGLNVSPKKSESDVGIYMVSHPENGSGEDMVKTASGRVPFETKEFLGIHDEKLHGDYKYPYSTNLVSSGLWPETLECECRTSELLIDALGFVWQCHHFLYDAWSRQRPIEMYRRLAKYDHDFSEHIDEVVKGESVHPIGPILDPGFSMDLLKPFRTCARYGFCVGCDTKVKNNRFQSLDDLSHAHTSVEINNVHLPERLSEILDQRDELNLFQPFLRS